MTAWILDKPTWFRYGVSGYLFLILITAVYHDEIIKQLCISPCHYPLLETLLATIPIGIVLGYVFCTIYQGSKSFLEGNLDKQVKILYNISIAGQESFPTRLLGPLDSKPRLFRHLVFETYCNEKNESRKELHNHFANKEALYGGSIIATLAAGLILLSKLIGSIACGLLIIIIIFLATVWKDLDFNIKIRKKLEEKWNWTKKKKGEKTKKR